MANQVELRTTPTTDRAEVPVTRRLAWTALTVLPLWVIAFVLLTAIAGTRPPESPTTLAEAVSLYAHIPTAAWVGWLLFSSATFALTSFTVLWLGRAVRGLRGGRIAASLATTAAALGLLDAVVTLYFAAGLKLADPPSYPPLVEALALDVEQMKLWVAMVVYGLLVAAAGIVAAVLWRQRALGRAAAVVAGVAAVLLLIVLVAPAPMLPAVVVSALGLVVLRHLRAPARG